MLFLTPNQQFQSTKGFFSLTFTEMCVVSVFVQIGNLRDTFQQKFRAACILEALSESQALDPALNCVLMM